MPLTVLVADRHPVVRDGLRSWLADGDFCVVAEVATAEEAVEAAVRLRPDVAVLDMWPGDDGTASACASIAERSPETATVVFAGELDEQSLLDVAEAGARGYLLKDATVADLPDVLRRIAAGERFVDPTAAAALFRAQRRNSRPRLTGQELNVVRLAAQGCTNRQIGERLYLSRHTVKEYLSHAMRKLEVDSRVEAVVEAERRGLLGPPPLAKAS
jgi:two-component system, NarL family, response regulator DevR